MEDLPLKLFQALNSSIKNRFELLVSLSGWGLSFWCHRIEFAFQKETKLLEVWWFQCLLFVLWFWVFIYCSKCLPPAFWLWVRVRFRSCLILKVPLSLFFLIRCILKWLLHTIQYHTVCMACCILYPTVWSMTASRSLICSLQNQALVVSLLGR